MLVLGLGLQPTLLSIIPIVLSPIIPAQATGASFSQLSWAVFAMLVVNGVTIILQAVRVGHFGSGLFVVTYPSAIAIPYCIIAVQDGGPSTLAALVIVSGLFQVAVSMRLSLLRQIVTATVSGTIIILMIVTVVGVLFGKIDDAPEGAPMASGPVCVAVTFVVSMGLLTGAFLIVAAFFPKPWGLLVGIPSPVSTVFLLVMMTPIFVEGMKLIIRDAPDYSKSLVVGVSMAIGMGLQFEVVVLPIEGTWGPMFQNGLTSGGIAVVLLTLASEFTGLRRHRIQAELNVESLPRIKQFLAGFSSRRGWNEQLTDRMLAVADETVAILTGQDGQSGDNARKLLLTANGSGQTAELEFVSAPGHAENLEDRITAMTVA